MAEAVALDGYHLQNLKDHQEDILEVAQWISENASVGPISEKANQLRCLNTDIEDLLEMARPLTPKYWPMY